MEKTTKVLYPIDTNNYDILSSHSFSFHQQSNKYENYKVEIYNGYIWIKTLDNTIITAIALPKPKELLE